MDYPDFHTIFATLNNIHVEFLVDNWKEGTKEIQVDNVLIDGLPVKFQEFADSVGKQAMNEFINKLPTATFPTNSYHYKTEIQANFQNQSLLVNGKSIESIRVKIEFVINVLRPRLLSKFDIETRGRILEYDNIIFIQQLEENKAFLKFKQFDFPK